MQENKSPNPIEFTINTRQSALSSTCKMFQDLYGATASLITNTASALMEASKESPLAPYILRREAQLDYDPIASATDNNADVPARNLKR